MLMKQLFIIFQETLNWKRTIWCEDNAVSHKYLDVVSYIEI